MVMRSVSSLAAADVSAGPAYTAATLEAFVRQSMMAKTGAHAIDN